VPVSFQFGSLFNAVVYALTGVILLALCASFLLRLIPIKLWHEIAEKQNAAAAILAGLTILAIAVVIAATMH